MQLRTGRMQKMLSASAAFGRGPRSLHLSELQDGFEAFAPFDFSDLNFAFAVPLVK